MKQLNARDQCLNAEFEVLNAKVNVIDAHRNQFVAELEILHHLK
jgi:outer membrane protein